MRIIGCQRHGHLNCTRFADDRVLNALQAELAALKAEHMRLREAAERALRVLGESETAWHLRAALDGGKGEPSEPVDAKLGSGGPG
jgi:hypothetical protein